MIERKVDFVDLNELADALGTEPDLMTDNDLAVIRAAARNWHIKATKDDLPSVEEA